MIDYCFVYVFSNVPKGKVVVVIYLVGLCSLSEKIMDMYFIMNYFVFAVLYLIMDVAWITSMSNPFYKHHFERIQQKPLKFKMGPAVLAYLTLLLTMFFVCIPLSNYYDNTYEPWFVFGVVGFCIYGIYNFTNGAVLTEYNHNLMLVDTAWGITSFALMGLLYKRLFHSHNWKESGWCPLFMAKQELFAKILLSLSHTGLCSIEQIVFPNFLSQGTNFVYPACLAIHLFAAINIFCPNKSHTGSNVKLVLFSHSLKSKSTGLFCSDGGK